MGQNAATPLLEECEDDIHTPEMGIWVSSEILETLEFDCKVKTSWIMVFFISLESYRSVNGLA
jgi:hypothetical protein